MILRQALTLVSGVALAACSVVGARGGTEEPRFDRVGQVADVEIRRYHSRVAAETTVNADETAARSEGFRRLAGYIFGKNRAKATIEMTAPVGQAAAGGSEKIAMTAPVGQAPAGDGAWTIRFFMPAKWTLDTLPAPDDDRVRLVAVPAETLAVLRFSGIPTAASVQGGSARLARTLDGSAWVATAQPVAWFYDPPWTLPFLRRNEVAVPVRPLQDGAS